MSNNIVYIYVYVYLKLLPIRLKSVICVKSPLVSISIVVVVCYLSFHFIKDIFKPLWEVVVTIFLRVI